MKFQFRFLLEMIAKNNSIELPIFPQRNEAYVKKSIGESNTVVSAYTLYRHLQQYSSHPSK